MTRRFCDIEELGPDHSVDDFDCGSDAQTVWLREHALQSQASRMSKVYVVKRLADDRVVGCHALSTGAVLHTDAPTRVAKGTGRFPIPVIVLARLGVDLSEQSQGLGRALVKDAFTRVNAAADIIGVRALLIHAEDEQARDFYGQIAKFDPSPSDPLHLLLLLKDLRRALSAG